MKTLQQQQPATKDDKRRGSTMPPRVPPPYQQRRPQQNEHQQRLPARRVQRLPPDQGDHVQENTQPPAQDQRSWRQRQQDRDRNAHREQPKVRNVDNNNNSDDAAASATVLQNDKDAFIALALQEMRFPANIPAHSACAYCSARVTATRCLIRRLRLSLRVRSPKPVRTSVPRSQPSRGSSAIRCAY